MKKGSEAEKRKRATAKGQRGPRSHEPRAQTADRRARFVAMMLADPNLNATDAVKAVGYTSQPARQASRMMAHPEVKAALAKALGPKMRELEITKDRVLQRLAQIAFGNILDFGTVTADGQFCIDLRAMDRVSAGAIASIKTETYTEGRGDDARLITRTELKMHDPRPAAETLGRYLRVLGNSEDGPSQEPIRLIIEHAPPQRSQEPLNITDLIEAPRR